MEINMHYWIFFMILYGLFKGMREPFKKSALEKNDLLDTLFLYTFIGFLFTIPISKDVFSITPKYLALVGLKSAVIFGAWMLSFIGVKKLPVSVYGIMDMSRVLFSTLMGVFVLGEALTLRGIAGLSLVILGLFMLNLKKGGESSEIKMKYIWITLLSCAMNAVSGVLDKALMSTGEVTSSQLQFWFMLLLSAMYFIYIYARGGRVNFKKGLKTPEIYVISALLIFGDKLLFIANSDPESRVTVMTLIKQCSVIVTIIAGKLIYKEKNIIYKTICAGVVIAGILTAVL